jgi:hypothetical protein
MSEPEETPDQDESGTSTVVEDLVLTEAFLIKGRVEGKFNRLSKMLQDSERRFVAIRDAMMVNLKHGEKITTPRVLVNIDQLILAHELVDAAGDYYQKQIATEKKTVRIRAFCTGFMNLEIAGLIRPGAYESDARFFIMEQPTFRGLDHDVSHDLAILRKLPYAIVQKQKLAYIYDFSF